MSEKKLIGTLKFDGFESLHDLERDVCEIFNPVYNPLVKDLPSEFTGTVKVTFEYEI